MSPARVLKRFWIPIVIVLAVSVSAVVIDRLRGVFGSAEALAEKGRAVESIVPINPKTVVYEILGPAGATGSVSYLDETATPRNARFARLPWSRSITTTAPSVFANIVAQSDQDRLACRITVDGAALDEQSTSGPRAQTSCLVKAG